MSKETSAKILFWSYIGILAIMVVTLNILI